MTTHGNKHLLTARLLAGGVKSFLPARKKYTGTGGSDSARHCYGVWRRRPISIAEAETELPPRVISELGTDDSLSLGMAALLSEIERYVALDMLAHTNVESHSELAKLIPARAETPDEEEFPELYHRVVERGLRAGAHTALGLQP